MIRPSPSLIWAGLRGRKKSSSAESRKIHCQSNKRSDVDLKGWCGDIHVMVIPISYRRPGREEFIGCVGQFLTPRRRSRDAVPIPLNACPHSSLGICAQNKTPQTRFELRDVCPKYPASAKRASKNNLPLGGNLGLHGKTILPLPCLCDRDHIYVLEDSLPHRLSQQPL
jgi:hypothetical protein